jgi:hypothetical protein
VRRAAQVGLLLLAVVRAGLAQEQAPTTGQVVRPPDPGTEKTYGLDAPLLAVDRFSDAAGTLFRRSSNPALPGPNAPVDFDREPFLTSLVGPEGQPVPCYALDLRPARPARYYVFYDRMGNYQLGQFPVVDVAPGDPGYTDLWDIWKVFVPDGFRLDNWVRDAGTVERLLADPDSGYRAEPTGVLLNGPVVPEGSTASRKGENRGGHAVLMYAWYRGKRAPYLYLEGSLRSWDGERVAEMPLELHETKPPRGRAEILSLLSRSVASVRTLPGRAGYSPLLRIPGSDEPLNCPVVGTGSD